MKHSINIKGRLLDLTEPIVMGILNVTPDSFYDGGKYDSTKSALNQAEKMLGEGATILDIGGMSSRPGAEIISIEEEKNRVLPSIKAIMKEFPEAIISIDTIHGEVARAAVGEGAAIINDISAGKLDENMYPTVAELDVPYILMHMRGKPKTMQENISYDDPINEVINFFVNELAILKDLAVKDIILDPGFGFGKSIQQNYEILARMSEISILDKPILTGISRKSMIYKYLDIDANQALNGTTALHIYALQQGTKFLRVHDVKEAKECIALYKAMSDFQ